ncbi:hypothetical protein AB9R10_07110, partial [Neisseria gonorrhoeae]
SPLATAMGGNKVSNWQAAKNVAVGLVSSKWNNAVNNSAGGRLVKHWEDEKKKNRRPHKKSPKKTLKEMTMLKKNAYLHIAGRFRTLCYGRKPQRCAEPQPFGKLEQQQAAG